MFKAASSCSQSREKGKEGKEIGGKKNKAKEKTENIGRMAGKERTEHENRKGNQRKGKGSIEGITYLSADPEKLCIDSCGVTQLSGEQLSRFVSH